MKRRVQAPILPIITAILTFLSWNGAKINWPYGLCALLCVFLAQRLIASGRLAEGLLPKFSNIRSIVLRDVITFVSLALLPAVAISFIATEAMHWGILIVALPIGLMTNAIFLANDPENIHHSRLYAFEVIFPYIWVGGCSVTGLMPMHTIIVFLTLAVALGCAKTLSHADGEKVETTTDLGARTLNLLVLFSLLLAISFLLPRFI